MSEKSNFKQKAYQIIKQKIIWAELPQGAPLREVQLSKELNISRTPVREAIAQLEQEGLAVRSPGRGSVIKTFDAKDIHDLFELREQLEIFSLEKIVHSISTESLCNMRQCCENFKSLATRAQSATTQEDFKKLNMEMVATDMNFHLQLLLNSKNRYVRKIIKDLSVMSNVIMLRSCTKTKSNKYYVDKFNAAYKYHTEIVDEIEAKNITRACKLLSEHLQSACARLMKDVEKNKPQVEKNWKSHVAQTLQLLEENM